MAPTTEAPVTYEEYAGARDALAALAAERAGVLKRGLDALRRWLAAGAGQQWLHHEAVVTRIRTDDLALGMWFDFLWREATRQATAARRQAERAKPAGQGSTTRIAAPSEESRPGGAGRPAPLQPAPVQPRGRSFAPAGAVWRPR